MMKSSTSTAIMPLWNVHISNSSVILKHNIIVDRLDEDFVSETVLGYFFLVNFWGVGQCVTILGLINNILNIVTLAKQGVRDTVNLSLLMLALSDWGSLFFLFIWNILSTPAFTILDLPFYPEQIRWHLGWIHVILIRVSTGITALITFERCLCIAAPLRVKVIITPRRTILCICFIYLMMAGYASPMFYTSKYTWIFDADRNKSILGLFYMENRQDKEDIVFVINAVLPTVIFIFIIACTVILVKTLNAKSRWRQKMATSSKEMSQRDTKAIKMVILISAVFIFCFAPGIVLFLWGMVDPELRPDGKHQRTMYVFTSIMIHLEAVNATANFFIYIKMSSKFKAAFYEMFCHELK